MSEGQWATASRTDLAARASARAQRNRPKGVLVLGVLVLGLGFVFMLMGRSSINGALGERRRELNSAQSVAMQGARLDRHTTSQTGPSPYEKVSNFTTIAQEAASSVGLSPAPSLTRETSSPPQNGILEREYRYERVQSADIEALVSWVAQVRSMVPGVEIRNLDIQPQRTQWQLSITFVKPEFAS